MLFLLAGGGKFNFQGTKKWIEDNVESSGGYYFYRETNDIRYLITENFVKTPALPKKCVFCC